jgi:Flp pilus assembly protein protease CpaA
MSVLRDVFEELFSMFVGDARLTVGILVVVAASATLAFFVQSWLSGAVLLLGCLCLLFDSVLHAARKSTGSP